MRFEFVFLNRSGSCWYCNGAQCSALQRGRPTDATKERTRPCGGVPQARAMSLASAKPSNNRGVGGVSRFKRSKAAGKPLSTSRLRASRTVSRATVQHQGNRESLIAAHD